MNRLLISLIALSLVSNSFAQDAVVLNTGDKAPFTGILITNSQVNDLRRAVIERDGLTSINESLKRSMALQDDIIARQLTQKGILLEQNDKLAVRLGESQSMGTWERVGFVVMGIAASGVAALAFKKIY